MWLIGSGSRSRAKVHSVQVQIVRLGIQAHSLGSVFSRYRFRFAELIWRVFMENVDHPFACGNKDEPGFRFIRGRIYPGGDWERLQYFSSVGIEHDEHLGIAPRAEEPVMLHVHGESRRRSSRSKRPA